MPEIAPRTDHEPLALEAEAYQRLQMMTSDIVFEQAKQILLAELSGDDDLVSYAQINELENELAARIRSSNDVGEQREIYAEIDEARQRRERLPDDTYNRFTQLNHRYNALNHHNTRVVSADSLEASAIFNMINDAPPVHPATGGPAPFSHFKNNNEEAWQHVPSEAIDDYLNQKIFRHPSREEVAVSTGPRIMIEGSIDRPLDIPTQLIVGAQSFDSWKGRDGAEGGKRISGDYADSYKYQSKSYDAIKHYASLPTEIPPVNTIELFVQPNGMIFGDNGEGDSHRLAAAILRGDDKVRARNITVTPIDINIF